MRRGAKVNKTIASVGAMIVTITTVLFAIGMLISFDSGCYFVCMFLAMGYIMMAAGLCNESDEAHKVAAQVGMIFAGIYATFILIVYFAQITTVRLELLNEQAIKIIDYSRGGLFFSYDLLGYGMMAISTFFVALTINAKTKVDKWLKRLMMLHGSFFFLCFIMPMTGVFSTMSNGETNIGGVVALEFWCAYFIPIGILAYIHFIKAER